MNPEMNYIDEFLYEVKRDEIGKVSDIKEWLEDNHHIFYIEMIFFSSGISRKKVFSAGK